MRDGVECTVPRPDPRVWASGPFINLVTPIVVRSVAHILHICFPSELVCCVQLIRDCAYAQWIDASLPHDLSFRIQYRVSSRILISLSNFDIFEKRTVALRVFVWRLSTDHRYVVVKALMADAVIMSQQDPLF